MSVLTRLLRGRRGQEATSAAAFTRSTSEQLCAGKYDVRQVITCRIVAGKLPGPVGARGLRGIGIAFDLFAANRSNCALDSIGYPKIKDSDDASGPTQSRL